jgi:hypothetical protein
VAAFVIAEPDTLLDAFSTEKQVESAELQVFLGRQPR